MDAGHLRDQVIRPVLVTLGLWSEAAEDLVLGTAAQESGLRFLRQLGGGPALGLYQMEPATHDDIWENFLRFRTGLAAAVAMFRSPSVPDRLQLTGNLLYATAMCRIHYYRVPAPLPSQGDVAGYAAYWKAHYNTAAGAGTEAEFARNYGEATKWSR